MDLIIEKYKQDFPEAITAIAEAQRNAQVRRNRLANENATLSIGIMGQVKAGKSSFLNSLDSTHKCNATKCS